MVKFKHQRTRSDLRGARVSEQHTAYALIQLFRRRISCDITFNMRIASVKLPKSAVKSRKDSFLLS